MNGRAVCGIAACVLVQVTVAAAQPIVTLTRDGRTLIVPQTIEEHEPIVFRIENEGDLFSPPDCFSRRPEAWRLQIRYHFIPSPEPPEVLGESSAVANAASGFHTVPAIPGPNRFLVFNLWEQSNPIESEAERTRLQQCVGRRRTIEASLNQALQEVATATTTLQDRTITAEDRSKRVKELLESIAAFQHVDGDGVAQVARLQSDLAAARTGLAIAEEDRDAAVRNLAGRTADLRGLEANVNMGAADFKAATDRLSDYLATKKNSPGYFEAMVLKVGGLLTRKSDRAVYYNLWNRTPTDVVAITMMGDSPVVHFGDRLYAVLTNVVLGAFPKPFAIRVTEHAGSVINTTPVRPVFEPGNIRTAAEAAAGAPTPPKVIVATVVYRDIFLPVSGTFAPNDYPEVTIVTEAANSEGKPQEVKIVDKAKFPQFRALYRYNLNTGVIRSRLRSPAFTKVKIVDDDPATDKVNEARYRVAEEQGHTQILPIFAFTFYPVPVDVQGPVTYERWIPAPTIGFGFTNPAKEVFLGLSHEVIRNMQVVWGWHFGEVTEFLNRNDVSEDHDATTPLTQKGRDRGFSVGVSFNINIVTKIFK